MKYYLKDREGFIDWLQDPEFPILEENINITNTCKIIKDLNGENILKFKKPIWKNKFKENPEGKFIFWMPEPLVFFMTEKEYHDLKFNKKLDNIIDNEKN